MWALDIISLAFAGISFIVVLIHFIDQCRGKVIKSRKLKFELALTQAFTLIVILVFFAFSFIEYLDLSYKLMMTLWVGAGSLLFLALLLLNLNILGVFGVLSANVSKNQIKRYKMTGVIIFMLSGLPSAIAGVLNLLRSDHYDTFKSVRSTYVDGNG